MREINNNKNANNINFQCIKPMPKDELLKEQGLENNEVTDLGKMPSEIIGRSQVVGNGIEKDIETYLSNPEVVETSMAFFDHMEKLGYTPEEAAAMMGKFAEEFSK